MFVSSPSASTKTYSSPSNRNMRNNLELLSACQAGYSNVVKNLLNNRNVDVNAKDKNGATALMKAAAIGHRDCIKQLLTSTDILVYAIYMI